MSKPYIFQLSWNYNNPISLRRHGGCCKNEDVLCLTCITGSVFGWTKMIGMKTCRCCFTNILVTSSKPCLHDHGELNDVIKSLFIHSFNHSFNQHLVSTYHIQSSSLGPLNSKIQKNVFLLARDSNVVKILHYPHMYCLCVSQVIFL